MISIIIPLYNKESTILHSINSILSQDFNDYEILVVDDGSTDNSISIIESIGSNKIRLLSKSNGGPSSARNYGIIHAKGEWILFLDADDKLEPNALPLIQEYTKKHRCVDIFSFNLYMKKNGLKELHVSRHKDGHCWFPFFDWYLGYIYPRTGNMVVRRQCMIKEPYREDLWRYEDAENTIRLMRRYRFYACKEPIFSYNQDSISASHRRNNEKEDFVCIMDPRGKSIGEKMMLFWFYTYEAKVQYPEYSKSYYGTIFHNNLYGRASRYLNKIKTFTERLRK